MIVDLEKALYVIDKKTQQHKIRWVDTKSKVVYAEGVHNADGQARITVEYVDGPYKCLSNVLEFQNLSQDKKQYYQSDEFLNLPQLQQIEQLSQDVENVQDVLMSLKYTYTDTQDLGIFYYSTRPLTVTIHEA